MYFEYGDKEAEYLKAKDKKLADALKDGYRPCKRCKIQISIGGSDNGVYGTL